jgi:hypothetical protein
MLNFRIPDPRNYEISDHMPHVPMFWMTQIDFVLHDICLWLKFKTPKPSSVTFLNSLPHVPVGSDGSHESWVL